MIKEFATYIKEKLKFSKEGGKEVSLKDILSDGKVKETMQKTLDYLNEEFLGWVEIINGYGLGAKYIYVTKYHQYIYDPCLNVTITQYANENSAKEIIGPKFTYTNMNLKIRNYPDLIIKKIETPDPIRRFTPEDPYGEEDWNDDELNEKIEFEDEKEYKIFDIKEFIDSKDKESVLKYLNENFTGWIELLNDRNIGAKFVYITEYIFLDGYKKGLRIKITRYKIRIDEKEECYDTSLRLTDGTNRDLVLIKRNVKEPTRIYSELDPYGEEEWLDESLNEKLKFLKDPNSKEASLKDIIDGNVTIDYLNKEFLGWIEIINGRGVGAKYVLVTKYHQYLYDPCLNLKITQYANENFGPRSYFTELNLKLKNHPDLIIKKIEVPEPIRKFTLEDPYGEEDWGEENESFTHDDIDPYGEEDWYDENSKFTKSDIHYLEDKGFDIHKNNSHAEKRTDDGGSIVVVSTDSDGGKMYYVGKFDKDDNNIKSIKGGHLGICFSEFYRY